MVGHIGKVETANAGHCQLDEKRTKTLEREDKAIHHWSSVKEQQQHTNKRVSTSCFLPSLSLTLSVHH